MCNHDLLLVFKQSIKKVQQQYPFEIVAWVQLPDHLHCIWKMPDDDANFGMRWSQIKRLTTQACPQYQLQSHELSHSKVSRNERGIWQRRFFEHCIRDEQDLMNHMDYLHYNPVKHGLVAKVADWQYSSFHRLVAKGIYPVDWGNDISYCKEFGARLE